MTRDINLASLTLLIMILAFLPAATTSAGTFLVKSSGKTDIVNKRIGWHDLGLILRKGQIKGGDTLLFEDGYFGKLELKNLQFENPVTLQAKTPTEAKLDSVLIRNSKGLIIDGFSVSPSYNPEYRRTKIAVIDKNSSQITLSNLEIFSIRDASKWGPSDWSKKASDGIRTLGSSNKINNNKLFNIGNGITLLSKDSQAVNNHITEFSKDGIRLLSDNTAAIGNRIQNCLSVDKNHDDAIQSWSYGKNGKVGQGVIRNVKLIGNTIFQRNSPATNLPCKMQGIGLFDGMYENWTIENNIVVVDHWHGITVMGAKSVKIINNTVVDTNDRKPGPANIKIFPHKNGQASTGNVVANNIAASYGKKGQGTLYTRNVTLRSRSVMFEDFESLNFRLAKNSPALNAAHQSLSPKTDIFGNARGSSSDAGAIQTSIPK